jgi:gas vesicle protein
MEFLSGIIVGIAIGLGAGVIFHLRRTREQREAFSAVCAHNEMLRRNERLLTNELRNRKTN